MSYVRLCWDRSPPPWGLVARWLAVGGQRDNIWGWYQSRHLAATPILLNGQVTLGNLFSRPPRPRASLFGPNEDSLKKRRKASINHLFYLIVD